MTRFQQAIKGAIFRILTYNLVQIVGIEQGFFFFYDTLTIVEMQEKW